MTKRLAGLVIVGLTGWLTTGPSVGGPIEEAAGRAAAAIEKLGGKVVRDLKAPGQPVVKVSLPACTCLRDEADLALLAALPDLRSLELRNDCKSSTLTDKGMKHLRKLTRLEYLHLGDPGGGPGISDAGLEHLKGLTSLRVLVLGGGTGLTEAGVKEFRRALPKATIRAPE